MNTLYSILVAIDVLLAIGIIGLILIQHGKGADVGAAFGSGASGTVFGSQGSASFLTRVTAILATLFFINSLFLAHLASNRPTAESVIDNVEQTSTTTNASSTDVANDVPGDIPDDVSNGTSGDVSSSDVPGDMPGDVPSEDGAMQDMTSETMSESDVPELPVDIEAQSDAVMNEAQDSMESIKEEIKSTIEEVSPNRATE